MLVDDAQVIRVMLNRILTDAGYLIVGEASNGQQAIDAYRKLRPDLVIMDITMPEMSGTDAVREIKKVDPDAKIVMCSAMGQKAHVVEAIEAGAKNFIVKPFEADKILEIVKALIGS